MTSFRSLAQRSKNTIARAPIVERAKYRRWCANPPYTTRALVDRHFELWSHSGHVNEEGLRVAISSLGGAPAEILETGTSAWGTDSTRLWDAYVRTFGGHFWSVDLSAERGRRLRDQLSASSTLIAMDSVDFIESWVEAHPDGYLDLVYLDSWDVDWADPLPSAAHGLKEWNAVQPALKTGSLVVIDDTPSDISHIPPQNHHVAGLFQKEHGVLPGKGALVLAQSDLQSHFELLYHHYNVVLRCL